MWNAISEILMPTGTVALFIIGCETWKSIQFVFILAVRAFSCSLRYTDRVMYYILQYSMECYRVQNHIMLTRSARHNETMMNIYSKPVLIRISRNCTQKSRRIRCYHLIPNDVKSECRHVELCQSHIHAHTIRNTFRQTAKR